MFSSRKMRHLILLTIPLLLTSEQGVYALDLTIDLPFNAGKAPMSYYSNPKNSFEQAPKNSSSLSQDISQQPVFVKPAYEKPIVKNVKLAPAPAEENFPELACLKDNIDFWEKVYSDIDLNEGVVHDKSNLARVYSVVAIPKGDRAKANFLKHEKKIIASRL
ncbi:MAG: hypothetical protein V4591_09145, partial [Bdellovibrionota bacterium]